MPNLKWIRQPNGDYLLCSADDYFGIIQPAYRRMCRSDRVWLWATFSPPYGEGWQHRLADAKAAAEKELKRAGGTDAR